MKRTPDPTHNKLYQHSELLRGITADAAQVEALKRGESLARSCRSIINDVAAALNKYGPKRWLQDTGSGNDLISKHEVDPKAKRKKLSEPLLLQTANDVIKVDTRVMMKARPTCENIEPLILESTPAVMSIGYRCVAKGFGFTWPPYSNRPYYDLPKWEKGLHVF